MSFSKFVTIFLWQMYFFAGWVLEKSHVLKLYKGPSFGLRGFVYISKTAVDSLGALVILVR